MSAAQFRIAPNDEINRLTKKLDGVTGTENHALQIACTKELMELTTDGRFKRSLSTMLRTLEGKAAAPKDEGDIRRRLDLLRSLWVELKDHPDYKLKTRQKRRKREL